MKPSENQNGAMQHWVTVRPDAGGQYTAQAVGLPEVRATAADRDEAFRRVREMVRSLVASGELMAIAVPPANTTQTRRHPKDPNDPHERAYLDALARDHQEDLEQTLRELDQECSNSSSTPTT
jgi:hypothetical protein